MGRDAIPGLFLLELTALLHGNLASAEFLTDTLIMYWYLELYSIAFESSAEDWGVVGICHDHFLFPDFLSYLDSERRWVNAIQAALNDLLESGRRTSLYSLGQSWMDGTFEDSPEESSEASIPSYAVVVSAVVLLALVYQYLTGNVDSRGGSKAYSRTSLDFRDIYVAIVLFQGAYVWIKFREAAPAGVHPRKLRDKQGRIIKEVHEARLTPPMWNGRKVPRLDLGRFATPQEAHTKFLIAAFYYGRNAGLVDGWFQVPPMSPEERSLTGLELRAWVIGQAKTVYQDFKRKEAERALLLQELLEAWDDQVTPEQDEVNADFSMASLLNLAQPQQPALASEVENWGMDMTMLDNHGVESASHSFDGMHQDPALSNGHSLGFQAGSALPVSRLLPNTESGMSGNGNDQLDSLQTLVGTQQQQISLQQQQISDQQQQIYLQQRQIQEFAAQISELQQQQRIQQRQQQLQVFRIQNAQWPYQFGLQQQQLQDGNQGFSSFEVEMAEHQQNCSGFMAPPSDGGEWNEAFWETEILTNT